MLFKITLFIMMLFTTYTKSEDTYRVDEIIYNDMKLISLYDNVSYVELHRDKIILVMKGRLIVLPTKGDEDARINENENNKKDKKSKTS